MEQSDPFLRWLGELETRHLADLKFAEVTRSLRALSANYVERRSAIGRGAPLSGIGKRAAFALFYGPLHFLLIRHIVESMPRLQRDIPVLYDLGCGTGAAGAAWASVCVRRPQVVGIDRHPWAADEARRAYGVFGVRGRVQTGDLARTRFPPRCAVLAAFTLNELDEASRQMMLTRLVEHGRLGNRILIIEPLAGFVAPWWNAWRRVFEQVGGAAEEWRVRLPLPPIVLKLDRAAGLNHRELTARSLTI